MSRVINKLAHYEGGIVPNVEQESPGAADDVPPPVESPQLATTTSTTVKKKKKKKKKAAPKKARDTAATYCTCAIALPACLLIVRE